MEELINKLKNHVYPESRLFNGKSCAIVGNSSKLLDEELGEEINSHDFVMRFNHAIVKGFEKHVGSKTSIRVINSHSVASFNGYDISENMKYFSKFSGNIFKELGETNFLAQKDAQLQNVKSLYPNLTFNRISNETHNLIDNAVQLQPTSGFIGIILALSHFDKISCFGFNFYDAGNDHYFEDVIKYDRSIVHSLDKEKEIVLYLNDNKLINFK